MKRFLITASVVFLFNCSSICYSLGCTEIRVGENIYYGIFHYSREQSEIKVGGSIHHSLTDYLEPTILKNSSEIKLGSSIYKKCSESIDLPPLRRLPGDLIGFCDKEKTCYDSFLYQGWESSFKPKAFFSQSMEYKLRYLKAPITDCNLPELINQHCENMVLNFISSKTPKNSYGKGPYPEEVENQFEEAVWTKLHKDYATFLSETDFKGSLRAGLKPGDRRLSAPLILYFHDQLAPRYELHYDSPTPLAGKLSKVFKLSSEFEELIGIAKEPKLVYEKGMSHEEFWELNRIE